MERPEIAIIVPARLASTRLPDKLLHLIQGKPLILWTAERIALQSPQTPLFFAVDSEKLKKTLEASGFSVVMTDPELPSGTDRIASANKVIRARHVINIQADEPLVEASHIETLKSLIVEDPVEMATLATPFSSEEEFRDPSRVKVVMGYAGNALYFSRAPIPYDRENNGRWVADQSYLHLGMYAYTRKFLENYPNLPRGKWEAVEKLEQLRAMEHGFPIRVGITEVSTLGIDTMEDIPEFEKSLGRS